jgi:DNA-directed RNA polymerase subunit RPC12/RpoP
VSCGGDTCRPTSIVVKKCGKSFERTDTITEHEAAKVRCPKCNSKKVTQVPGRVHVVTSKKS